MGIGENIKKARLSREISQEILAERVGVSRATISAWESERNEPNIGMAIKISEVLHCDINEIAYGTGNEKEPSKEMALSDSERLFVKALRDSSETRRMLAYAQLLT